MKYKFTLSIFYHLNDLILNYLFIYYLFVCLSIIFHQNVFDEKCVCLLSFPVAQMVEHGASNAKIMGSIPRESKSW